MTKCSGRSLAVAAAVIVLALTSSSVDTRAQEDANWNIGDLFVGVGHVDYLPGEYWVFDYKGDPKLVGGVQQKVVDGWSSTLTGVATGCMIAPNGSLYATSYHGLTVSKFDGSPTNGALVTGSVVGMPSYSALDLDPLSPTYGEPKVYVLWLDPGPSGRLFIVAADTTNDWFEIPGDRSLSFLAGRRFEVTGATANNGQWEVSESAYDDTTGRTRVSVTGDITAATADGYISEITGTWPLFAIESIVFDASGNYFVGGQGMLPEDEFQQTLQKDRPAFIFRYNADHTLDQVFEVPSGLRGVDQLDLGSDSNYPTLYYTSEDTKIRVFRSWKASTDADRVTEIQVKDNGIALEGSLYALRALPPRGGADDAGTPEDETLLPSGFLVASSTDVLRVDADGNIIRRFSSAELGIGGQRFALNITPDGQSFWTATYPGGDEMYPPSDPPEIDDVTGEEIPNSVGHLIKFHIPTGAILADIPVGAGAVWGLCLKREYTAGINTCHVTDLYGKAVDADLDGLPDTKPCSVPVNCAPGQTEGDCKVPGSPEFNLTIPDTTNYVDDVVTGYPAVAGELASSPWGLPITYSIGPPAQTGLSLNPSTGRMSGTILSTGVGTWEITVKATDTAGRSATTTFTWTITAKPGNPPPTLYPNPISSNTGHASNVSPNFVVTVLRSHTITYQTVDSQDGVWVAASTQRLDIAGAPFEPGLPPGYTLLNPIESFGRQPEAPLPAGFGLLGLVEGLGSDDARRSILLGTTAPGNSTVEGRYKVWIAIMDNPQGSSWGDANGDGLSNEADRELQLADHDWMRPAQNQQFTLAVVNEPPVFVGTPIDDKDHLIGTPIPGLTQISGSDPDAHYPLSYTLSGVPSGPGNPIGTAVVAVNVIGGDGEIVSTTGQLTGIAQETFDADVRLDVIDFAGKKAMEPIAFHWRVYNNRPAIASCPASRTDVAGRGATSSVPLLATDGAEDTLAGQTLTSQPAPGQIGPSLGGWEIVSGPSWITIDRDSGVLTASREHLGVPQVSATVIVRVRDNWGLASDAGDPAGVCAFTWTITNAAPVFAPGTPATQTSSAGTAVWLDLNADDTDGHTPLVFSAAQLPAWLTLDSATGVLSGTAPSTPVTETIAIVATDDLGLSATHTLVWTVANASPVLAVANQSTLVGTTASYAVTATDADGHALTYTIAGLPLDQFAISGNTITANPTATTATPYAVTVTVTDGFGGSDTGTFTWSVFNNAPYFVPSPPPNRQSQADTAVSVQLVADDPDPASHDPLAFALAPGSSLPAGLTMSPSGLITGIPTLPLLVTEQTTSVTVVVTDRFGASSAGTFTWRIYGNHPPVCAATASPAFIWPANHKMVKVAIQGVTDPDGDPVALIVSGIFQDEPVNAPGDGNTGADGSGVGTATPYVRAERNGHPEGAGRVYHIQYTATDSKGESCSGVVTVAVPHDPKVPVIDGGPLFDSTIAPPVASDDGTRPRAARR